MCRIALLLLVLTPPLAAQGVDYIREHYTKYEYLIPMRDGIRLFTSVYVPKDDSKTYPIMLNRTPYSVGPYGEDQYRAALGPSEKFARDGFIFAMQDVRGRYQSEGKWVEVRPQNEAKKSAQDIDESTDTWDTIEWLVKHVKANNGKVGMWGISYPGFYVAAGMIDSHPALKAASPQAPIGDYFLGDDSFHNGAFMLAANFGFYAFFVERKGDPAPPKQRSSFEFGTPDGYDYYLRMGPLGEAEKLYKEPNPYWSMNLEHTTYDDFWKARAIVRHLRKVTPAVMTVGGWFDAEDLSGPLKVFRKVESLGTAAANMLVMGPWSHGGWSRGEGQKLGNLDFASKTGEYYRNEIEFVFFQAQLKGTGEAKLPKAWVFQTGTNEWRKFDAWPPKEAIGKTMYLGPDGTLTGTAPPEGFDEYVSDPAHPVPYVGFITLGMRGDYMTEDQRFAGQRPDVLVYQTEPLAEDMEIAGPVHVRLSVSTTGTDSDFVVKVVDVYPNDYPEPVRPAGSAPLPGNAVKMGGYQQLVRGEPFRGKFRNSFEKPEAFVPGQRAKIEFDMPDVCHVFRRGHRVMVQVQSSWFPLVDRNPQKFLEIPFAKQTDFVKATERVWRGISGSSVSF
jgi:putative CocE/NonD family hydrolase